MRTLVIAIVASLLLVGSANADLTCSSAMTLDTLVTCIRDQMPKAESDGYVAPTPSQRATGASSSVKCCKDRVISRFQSVSMESCRSEHSRTRATDEATVC